MAVTAGSGGPFTDRTNAAFTADNGLTSRYHLYAAGVPTTRPIGLLVHFHGDGGYEYRNPRSTYALGGDAGIIAVAKAHEMVTLVALTPDTTPVGSWVTSGDAHADYTRDLVVRVAFDAYPIDLSRVWLVGYQGGARFITQHLVPRYADTVTAGGAVLFGGGGPPLGVLDPGMFDAAITANLRMHWYVGANDDGRDGSVDVVSESRAAATFYGNAGFTTVVETATGVGRSLSGRFGPVVDAHLDAYAQPVLPEVVTYGVTAGHLAAHSSLHAQHNADGLTPVLPAAVTVATPGHDVHHAALKDWYDAAHPLVPLTAVVDDATHEAAHEFLAVWDNSRTT